MVLPHPDLPVTAIISPGLILIEARVSAYIFCFPILQAAVSRMMPPKSYGSFIDELTSFVVRVFKNWSSFLNCLRMRPKRKTAFISC